MTVVASGLLPSVDELVGAIVGATAGADVADSPTTTGAGVKASSGKEVGKYSRNALMSSSKTPSVDVLLTYDGK